MSQTPQNAQNNITDNTTNSDNVTPQAAEEQITDAQLEQVAGGKNVQGTRLENLSNQTVEQPASLENVEEISI